MAGQDDKSSNNTGNRGFASMDEDKQRDIASQGGRAAHASGNANEFSSAEAREAGSKGGQASQGGSNNPQPGGQGGGGSGEMQQGGQGGGNNSGQGSGGGGRSEQGGQGGQSGVLGDRQHSNDMDDDRNAGA